MAEKLMIELAVGDSVKLPGYASYVKVTEIQDLGDRYIIGFTLNNSPNSCALLKSMIADLEPFDVKPATRN